MSKNREIESSTVLTGDRPTGPLHLGHYAGSLKTRVALQERGERCFVMIADCQAYTDNVDNVAKVTEAIRHLVADYLAVGIAPEKTCVFLQSGVPELAELTVLYMNMVTVARLERNPTVREEIKQRGFVRGIPAGFLCYPVSQAADITGFRADVVPVGEDQLPMIELAQEVANRINRAVGSDLIPIPKAMLSDVGRLPGTDGKAKASKSLGNAIHFCDDATTVRNKVMSMFTDPGHLRVSDPGKVEGNAVFAYLDAFDPDKEEVQALKERYRKGGLGDVTLKKRLAAVLEDLIGPIRQKREAAYGDAEMCVEVLRSGTIRAREAVAETLSSIKKGLGMCIL